jgi:hypothetical protein
MKKKIAMQTSKPLYFDFTARPQALVVKLAEIYLPKRDQPNAGQTMLLAGGSGLLADLLAGEHRSDCYYRGNLRTAQWQKSCERGNSHLD